jgi:opacity protein-like surface antigen
MSTSRIFTVLLAMTAMSCTTRTADAARVSLGVQAGLRAGIGVEGNAMVKDFAEGFPMALRLAAGYSRREAGKADDARRIFINDNTGGTPEEKAWLWDLRLDFMYDFGWSSSADIYVTGGVRYSMFTANFKFVDGNEDFDVTSNQWGLGAGLEGYFNITQKLQFVVSGGVDYYFPSTLKGHDTEYNPDGDDVNPRDDYTYDDADDAVNQLSWEPRALIGLSYWFGS